jgi:NADH-quinone oxidoreductase subunit H
MQFELLSTLNLIKNSVLYVLSLSIMTLVPLLISIAFFTLAERKVMASIQRRRGPNVVGMWGLLQPFADGLKALIKELIIPYQANRFLFILAPCITFVLSLVNWAILPFSYNEVIADLNYGLLYIYALSSLAVYGIILAGWVSQSKYPFLGAIRSAAQMISYEVSIGLIFVIIALCAHSLNLMDIVYAQEVNGWFIVTLFPMAGVFFISIIAETNRAPFDLPEAEAEIVAGYNLEYSSIIFAFFFLGEYGNILLMSALFSILFLGGWLPLLSVLSFISPELWLQLKTIAVCYMFILVRATLPRYRYDQLMDLCWQVFLPFNLLYLLTLMFVFLLAV